MLGLCEKEDYPRLDEFKDIIDWQLLKYDLIYRKGKNVIMQSDTDMYRKRLEIISKENPLESYADIKFYDFKKKQIYTEKALAVIDGVKIVAVGNECDEYMRTHEENDLLLVSPIRLGRVTDFDVADAILNTLFQKYFKKGVFKSAGLFLFHEDLTEAEKKPFEDILCHMDCMNVFVVSERDVTLENDATFEEFVFAMHDRFPKLRFAMEVTKQNPRHYAKYAVDKLLKDCRRWGVEKEELQAWLNN